MKATSIWGMLVALVLASVLLAAPIATAVPRYETSAYYSVVRDNPEEEEPFAPFTDEAEELRRTSIYAYYSVVR